MSVSRSLSVGTGTLKQNPLIIALVFAFSLMGAGLVGLQMINPLLVLVGYLVILLVMPFFLGGIIGTIHEEIRGRTSFGRFITEGKSNYLSLLAGTLVLGVVMTVLYFVLAIVGVILSVFVLGFGSMAGATSASFVVLALVGLVGWLILMLPWFFLQFFPAAVVVDDLALIDSFKRSGGLVRNHFLSVVGFDVLAFLISLVAQIPTVYLFYQYYTAAEASSDFATSGKTMFDLLSTTELGIYLTMLVVLGTVVVSVSYAYYVAYYDQLPGPSAI